MEEIFTLQFAGQVITEALDKAIKSGCFNLIETTNIVKSIDVINQNLKLDGKVAATTPIGNNE